MKTITITLSGGVIQNVDNPCEDVIVHVKDYDVEPEDAKNDSNCVQDQDGNWYQCGIY